MKRPQTKFYADSMNHSKAIRSKNSPNFLAAQFFFFIDILLKLQKQILICFCKF